jgi:Fe-S cluster biogenesis protein NfuA
MMTGAAPAYSIEDRIRGLVDQIDAYIAQYHGGGVKFVSFDGKVVRVHMEGACAACTLQPATLHGWVEGTLKQFFPQVEKVEEA